MEFPFAIKTVLPEIITKVTNTLLPENFPGRNGKSADCASKMSDILDEMGVASAKAQDLKKAITSGAKLRSSDHVVYFLREDGGKQDLGTVVGLLKIGYKKLYLFDRCGVRHEVQALCILDFYVHESKQRVGCGKVLYEHMLKEENIQPEHLAIDRPSDKLIHFLYKHYGLKTILPQANHYVIFEEFFSKQNDNGDGITEPSVRVRTVPTVLASYPPLDASGMEPESYNGLQTEGYGRHAASKPICSMGKILHNPNAGDAPKNTGRVQTACGMEENIIGSPGPHQLTELEDEMLTKNLFLHSRLW